MLIEPQGSFALHVSEEEADVLHQALALYAGPYGCDVSLLTDKEREYHERRVNLARGMAADICCAQMHRDDARRMAERNRLKEIAEALAEGEHRVDTDN